jgi:hypothetical protein
MSAHLRLALAATLLLPTLPLAANDGYATVPLGAINYTIQGGTLASPRVTPISVPLRDSFEPTNYNDTDKTGFTGVASGLITSISAGPTASTNSLTIANAGWDPLQFRQASRPVFVRVMTGNAQGRTLLAATNRTDHTSSTVIVDHQGFSLLGSLSAGDRVEFFPGDTLRSFFGDLVGAGLILSGPTVNDADNVQLLSGSQWVTYFHDGTKWRISSVNVDSGNVIIRPDAGFLFVRRGSSNISFTALGTVPSTRLQCVIRTSGTSLIGTQFPVSRSLSTTGISSIPGWVTSSSSRTADRFQTLSGTQWVSYFNDGTNWRIQGPNSPSNPNIPPTSVIRLQRLGNATTTELISFELPYQL